MNSHQNEINTMVLQTFEPLLIMDGTYQYICFIIFLNDSAESIERQLRRVRGHLITEDEADGFLADIQQLLVEAHDRLGQAPGE